MPVRKRIRPLVFFYKPEIYDNSHFHVDIYLYNPSFSLERFSGLKSLWSIKFRVGSMNILCTLALHNYQSKITKHLVRTLGILRFEVQIFLFLKGIFKNVLRLKFIFQTKNFFFNVQKNFFGRLGAAALTFVMAWKNRQPR